MGTQVEHPPSNLSSEKQSLLGHHLQLGPSPDHGRAQHWGPLILLYPGAPQPHSHLHLLSTLQAAGSDLGGDTQGDLGRAGIPSQALRAPWLSHTLPAPSCPTGHGSCQPWYPSITGAVPAAQGCQAEPRPALHPSFPFLRLIAPVAAEPSIKHLIFYSHIELENIINISLELKDPSQPGTMSQPAGGITPVPGGAALALSLWEEENQEGKSHMPQLQDKMVSQDRGDISTAHWLGDLLGMAHPCSTLSQAQDTKQ